MPALGVRGLKPPHELNELAVLFWPNHQMKVIRHDAVREQPHAGSCLAFSHDVQECPIVTIRLKQPSPADSPIENVENKPTGPLQLSPWHIGPDFKFLANV